MRTKKTNAMIQRGVCRYCIHLVKKGLLIKSCQDKKMIQKTIRNDEFCGQSAFFGIDSNDSNCNMLCVVVQLPFKNRSKIPFYVVGYFGFFKNGYVVLLPLGSRNWISLYYIRSNKDSPNLTS